MYSPCTIITTYHDPKYASQAWTTKITNLVDTLSSLSQTFSCVRSSACGAVGVENNTKQPSPRRRFLVLFSHHPQTITVSISRMRPTPSQPLVARLTHHPSALLSNCRAHLSTMSFNHTGSAISDRYPSVC